MRDLGILLLTHSSRPVDMRSCSLNYLTQRYEDPERLRKVPPFEELLPERTYTKYFGSLSIYRVSADGGGSLALRHVGSVKNKEKIQHATQVDAQNVLVCFEYQVERWKQRWQLVSRDWSGSSG